MKPLSTILRLSILFFIVLNVSAQEVNIEGFRNSIQTGLDYFEKQDYRSANSSFELAVSQIDSLFSDQDLEPIDALYYYGNSLFRLNEFSKASNVFQSAMNRLNRLDEAQPTYYDRIQHDLAATLVSGRELERAQKEYTDLVQRTRVTPAETEELFLIRLYQLGELCDSTGDSNCFYESFSEILSILDVQGNTASEMYTRAANYLAIFNFVRNDFHNAIPYFEVVLKFPGDLPLGNVNLKMFSHYYYAVALFRLTQFERSRTEFDNALKYLPEINPSNIGHYSRVMADLAESQFMIGKVEDARKTLLKSMEKTNEVMGEKSKSYAISENSLGEFYIKIGQYNKAKIHLANSEANFIRLNDSTSLEYGRVLANLGLVNFSIGKYIDSEKQLKKALELESSNQGESTISYANILGNYANLFHLTGRYTEAREAHLRSLDLKAKLLTESDPVYAKGLMNYGNFLMESGNLEEAGKVLTRSSKIVKDKLGGDHISYADQLMNLGQLNYTKRDFKEAIQIYENARDIYFKKSDSDNPGYGMALTSLGLIYKDLGDYKRSIQLQEEALKFINKTLGLKHIEYVKICQNLAQTYQQTGNYQKALEQYNIALDVLESMGMDDQYLYGLVATNTALLKMQFNEMDEAIDLIQEALGIFISTHGKNSFYYASALQVKAILLLRTGRIDESINALAETQKLYEMTLGRDNDAYLSSGFIMALAYDVKDDVEKALTHYREYNKGIVELLKDVFSFRSEEDKRKYLAILNQWLSWYNSLLLDNRVDQSVLSEEILNNTLLFKGLLLSTTLDIFKKLSSLDDPVIAEKLSQLVVVRSQLTRSLNSAKQSRQVDIDNLKESVNELETELVRLYDANFNQGSDFEKDWKDIRDNLKQGEIAIEFTHFQNRGLKSGESEIVYIGFIITPESEKPLVVQLAKEAELLESLKSKTPNQLYSARGSVGSSMVNSKLLYDVIWKPLYNEIKNRDIETIYYSPSGILNQISFAALKDENMRYLSQSYRLVRLGSTYRITRNLSNPTSDSAMFIGGLDYDYSVSSKASQNLNYLNSESLRNSRATRGKGESWDYLPGTLNEIKSLLKLFNSNNNSVSSLVGRDGTEDQFKSMSGNSPDLIHIATHGFFFENIKSKRSFELSTDLSNIYKDSEDPLLRSGLILSGGNMSWNSPDNSAGENGILTAMEISNLDLSNTDMVVLSACETGLGDIDGSEGVYGLQRAFKMAGVDIIVMSLWQVPDKETAEFMSLFYENWLGGQDVRTAFSNTQKTMQQRYKDEPLKWAAFVLFE